MGNVIFMVAIHNTYYHVKDSEKPCREETSLLASVSQIYFATSLLFFFLNSTCYPVKLFFLLGKLWNMTY